MKGRKIMLKRKNTYPREWPNLNDKDNEPLVRFDGADGIQCRLNSAIIIYEPDRFTASQKAYLLSMFKPEQDDVCYIPVNSEIGNRLRDIMNLDATSHLIYQDGDANRPPQLYHLFLEDRHLDELDLGIVDNIACKLPADPLVIAP